MLTTAILHYLDDQAAASLFKWPAHIYDMGESFWSQLPENLGLAEEYQVTASRPAIIETTFASSPLQTVAAHLLKAPWRLLGNGYRLVGGWEVIIERKLPSESI